MKGKGVSPPVSVTLERIAGYEFGVRVEGPASPATTIWPKGAIALLLARHRAGLR